MNFPTRVIWPTRLYMRWTGITYFHDKAVGHWLKGCVYMARWPIPKIVQLWHWLVHWSLTRNCKELFIVQHTCIMDYAFLNNCTYALQQIVYYQLNLDNQTWWTNLNQQLANERQFSLAFLYHIRCWSWLPSSVKNALSQARDLRNVVNRLVLFLLRTMGSSSTFSGEPISCLCCLALSM